MTNTTTSAAELTQEQVQKVLVQPLEQASTFLSAGVTIVDSHGPIRFPKGPQPLDPSELPFTGEGEEIPEQDADFSELKLLPSTMKSVKTLTRFTAELARSSVVALDAALKSRLVGDVAAKVDAQAWSASGDGITTPRGLFAQPGIQTLPVGGALTLDHLLDAQAMALAENANPEAMKFVLTSGDFVRLRKLKDGDGRYQLNPDPTQPGKYTLFGIPVIVTNRIPDTSGQTPTGRAALVDFSNVVVVRDVESSVKILDQTFATTDEIGIRCVTRLDFGLTQPKSAIALTGITR